MKILLLPMLLAATCTMAEVPSDLPYSVPIEMGEAEFATGDSITITSVRGTAPTLTTNQTYAVDGTYTLASRDQAELCFFVTTTHVGSTPRDPEESVRVTNGSGTFHLVKKMREEGYPHLTFYPVPQGNGFGGVYFGQGAWVLTNKSWSYLKPAAGTPVLASNLSDANKVLYEYLGEPVPWPAGLDAKYSALAVRNAVVQAAHKAGLVVKNLIVDDSEFPPVIALVIPNHQAGGAETIEDINNQIKAMQGYEYNGSISSSTCKVFTIVPGSAYPPGTSQQIEHRLGLRREVLFELASKMQ